MYPFGFPYDAALVTRCFQQDWNNSITALHTDWSTVYIYHWPVKKREKYRLSNTKTSSQTNKIGCKEYLRPNPSVKKAARNIIFFAHTLRWRRDASMPLVLLNGLLDHTSAALAEGQWNLLQPDPHFASPHSAHKHRHQFQMLQTKMEVLSSISKTYLKPGQFHHSFHALPRSATLRPIQASFSDVFIRVPTTNKD